MREELLALEVDILEDFGSAANCNKLSLSKGASKAALTTRPWSHKIFSLLA